MADRNKTTRTLHWLIQVLNFSNEEPLGSKSLRFLQEVRVRAECLRYGWVKHAKGWLRVGTAG